MSDDIAMLIELPDVYDGWSVKMLMDGALVNRWDKDQYPWRYAEAQKWIDSQNEEEK